MRKIRSLGKYCMQGELLGSGNFGRVELATHSLTSVKVAIKIIDTRKINTSYANRNLYREARILSSVRHPNIVRMYETLKASYLYCLVLEYVPNIDLNSYLQGLEAGRLSEKGCWSIVRQITSAVVYLHQRNIVHRDLKMDNILLDESQDSIKIIDFGLSNTFETGALLSTHCGSPEFAAPELFYDRHDYGPEVDAWSFGVILYCLVVGKLPFIPGSTEPSKRHALLKMLNKGLVQQHRVRMLHLSLDLRSLLIQLIEPNPKLRLDMFGVAEHTWITREGRYPVSTALMPHTDMPLRAKVIQKLSTLNNLDPEYVESQVSELKCDSLSSQYNMLMDRYSHIRRVRKVTNNVVVNSCVKPSVRVKTSNDIRLTKKPISVVSGRMKGVLECAVKDDTHLDALKMKYRSVVCATRADVSTSNRPIITLSACHHTDDVMVEPGQNSGTTSLTLSSADARRPRDLHWVSTLLPPDISSSLTDDTDICVPPEHTSISAASTVLQDLVRDCQTELSEHTPDLTNCHQVTEHVCGRDEELCASSLLEEKTTPGGASKDSGDETLASESLSLRQEFKPRRHTMHCKAQIQDQSESSL